MAELVLIYPKQIGKKAWTHFFVDASLISIMAIDVKMKCAHQSYASMGELVKMSIRQVATVLMVILVNNAKIFLVEKYTLLNLIIIYYVHKNDNRCYIAIYFCKYLINNCVILKLTAATRKDKEKG